jgi:hypothetical protein
VKDEGVDRQVGVATPPAHGHGDAVSIERQRDSSSSLHAIVAREAARLGRPRQSRRLRLGGVVSRSTLTSASRWRRAGSRSRPDGPESGFGVSLVSEN